MKYLKWLLVIGIIVAGAYYWQSNHYKISKAGIMPWLTFSNEAYGYTVSYPEEWFVDSSDSRKVVIQPTQGQEKGSVVIEIEPNTGNLSIEERVVNEYKGKGKFTQQYLKLGGHEAMRAFLACPGTACGEPEIFSASGNQVYHLYGLSADFDMFNAIAGTFRFN